MYVAFATTTRAHTIANDATTIAYTDCYYHRRSHRGNHLRPTAFDLLHGVQCLTRDACGYYHRRIRNHMFVEHNSCARRLHTCVAMPRERASKIPRLAHTLAAATVNCECAAGPPARRHERSYWQPTHAPAVSHMRAVAHMHMCAHACANTCARAHTNERVRAHTLRVLASHRATPTHHQAVRQPALT